MDIEEKDGKIADQSNAITDRDAESQKLAQEHEQQIASIKQELADTQSSLTAAQEAHNKTERQLTQQGLTLATAQSEKGSMKTELKAISNCKARIELAVSRQAIHLADLRSENTAAQQSGFDDERDIRHWGSGRGGEDDDDDDDDDGKDDHNDGESGFADGDASADAAAEGGESTFGEAEEEEDMGIGDAVIGGAMNQPYDTPNSMNENDDGADEPETFDVDRGTVGTELNKKSRRKRPRGGKNRKKTSRAAFAARAAAASGNTVSGVDQTHTPDGSEESSTDVPATSIEPNDEEPHSLGNTASKPPSDDMLGSDSATTSTNSGSSHGTPGGLNLWASSFTSTTAPPSSPAPSSTAQRTNPIATPAKPEQGLNASIWRNVTPDGSFRSSAQRMAPRPSGTSPVGIPMGRGDNDNISPTDAGTPSHRGNSLAPANAPTGPSSNEKKSPVSGQTGPRKGMTGGPDPTPFAKKTWTNKPQ